MNFYDELKKAMKENPDETTRIIEEVLKEEYDDEYMSDPLETSVEYSDTTDVEDDYEVEDEEPYVTIGVDDVQEYEPIYDFEAIDIDTDYTEEEFYAWQESSKYRKLNKKVMYEQYAKFVATKP